MKLGSVKYLIGEGFKSAWVNRLMTLASIGVLVACMVIIGLAILISENANKAMGAIEQQNVVMAYMKDYTWALYDEEGKKTQDTSSEENTSSSEDSSEDTNSKEKDKNGIKSEDYVIHNEKEAKALCDKIAKLENVEDVVYISGEQSLDTVKSSMSDEQKEYFTFLDEEYGNPLSGAAKVTMKDMALFDETVKEIEKINGVSDIQSSSELAATITAIKEGIGVAGAWIIAILMIIALVIVSNTIRVTMYNRKLDISIMKAVGATDAFIRIPFVVEGVVIGLISAVIAEVILYFCYRVATETIISTISPDIVKYGDMALILLLVFIGIGVLAGVIGSVIIISKYLRREGSEFSAI